MKINFIFLAFLLFAGKGNAQANRLIDLLQRQGFQSERYCLYDQQQEAHATNFYRYPTLGKPLFPKDISEGRTAPFRKFDIYFAENGQANFISSGSGHTRGFSFSLPFRYGRGIYATLFPDIAAVLMLQYNGKKVIAELYYLCPNLPDL
ncbi:MAG: hypothetical protein AAF806_24570 [Bacteroidota bacterium]